MSNFILRFLSSLILAPLFIYFIYANNFLLICLLILILILAFFELKFLIKKNIIIFLSIFLVIIFFLYALFALRGNETINFYYLFWLIILVWLADIGGYFIGKIFGGKKFSKWSPKKTYAGLFGSIFFSQLSIFVVNAFFYLTTYSIFIAIVQFIFCIIAVFGDLFFSFIKRKHGIKDYSSIIPGHGGILDRIDGLIFVTIFYYLIKDYYVF